MADASGLRQALIDDARRIHTAATLRMAQQLTDATPFETGRLARAAVIGTTQGDTLLTSRIEQPAGEGEPADLPEWLDQGVEFEIVPVRAKALRFQPRGGPVVFTMRAHWRPRPGSVGFWSRTITAQAWSDALEESR